MVCGRSVFLGRPRNRVGRGMRGAGRGSSVDFGLGRATRPRWSGGDGLQGAVVEGFEDVVAAFEQFAGHREAGAVPADPLSGGEVVGAVGAALAASGHLRGLVQRPAQRRRALAGEVPRGAIIVGLLHGDVQAAVTDDVPGAREAAGVTELGQDRHGGQFADPGRARR